MTYPYYPTYSSPYQQNYYQQNQSPVMNQSGIIWVSGAQEAAMYPIAPNNAVALWAKDGKTIFLKQADATGKPLMTVYDLVERKEDVSEKQDIISDDYAKKSDLAAVAGIVKGFDELIASIKADVDSMKGDMYGIAGKRKSSKKAEVVEDGE